MPRAGFGSVTAWVFDLDNTLYDPALRLFDQIDRRITAQVMAATGTDAAGADRLRRDYWQRYGTTLAGLMAHHRVDPEAYLADVHDICFDALTPDPRLRAAIAALPGRRIVHTNASAPFARRVLAARGLEDLFEAVFGVEHTGYRPKPRPEAHAAVVAAAGIAPDRAAMFEDDPRNLTAPHAMGMRTVHVAPAPAPAPHVDHHTDDLAGFLTRLA
jgi:putative hydrolase of the HAD superfamily